jgi:hypothetical protein
LDDADGTDGPCDVTATTVNEYSVPRYAPVTFAVTSGASTIIGAETKDPLKVPDGWIK